MNKGISHNKWRWYGFDLDGTIANNDHHQFGYGEIGSPIKPMIRLMKRLHKSGCKVKIVTARLNDVGEDGASQLKLKRHIWRWCDKNLGFRPEITDRKDGLMECLYDDRARQIVRNQGVNVGDLAKELARVLDGMITLPSSNMKEAVRLRNRCKKYGLF